jgi:hypothetical protein
LTQVTLFGPRGDEWKSITGMTTFPVKSSIPFSAALPGRAPGDLVYLLDLDAMDVEVMKKIILHLCTKFGMTAKEAADELHKGIPILAEDCIMATDEVRAMG